MARSGLLDTEHAQTHFQLCWIAQSPLLGGSESGHAAGDGAVVSIHFPHTDIIAETYTRHPDLQSLRTPVPRCIVPTEG